MQPATVPQNDVTPREKVAAEAEIRKMRAALAGWLKYRSLNDAVAAGTRASKVPPGLAKKMVESGRDWGLEQRMANQLHVLLSEMFDASQLPQPDLNRDPRAAVKLAQIAVAGRLPDEASAPSAVGFVWLWPAVVVVGLVLFTVVYKIRSDAEVAEEKERLECVKMGACTDYGFWLKMGAVAVLGYFAWTKLGGRELVGRVMSRAGGG